jgi:hypothetical protein
LHLCWIAPAAPGHFDSTVFGFGKFIAALALLVIVYTITDFRYRFRINAAPLRIRPITFWLITFIGISTLLTEVWLREGWPILRESIIDQSVWEAILGAAFLGLALLWMYFAFIKPERFGRWNYLNYGKAVYQTILKGADDELSVLADELTNSAEALVKYSGLYIPKERNTNRTTDKKELKNERVNPTPEGVAHDVLLMLGNRKLCRTVAANSPATAIALFSAAANSQNKERLPLSQFSKNLSVEAISNKDSILYHETEGFDAGYFGYVKPFSEAVYGNYELVESLGSDLGSQLDIRYDSVLRWDELQLSAYSRVVLVTINAYLRERRSLKVRSFALNRALDVIRYTFSDLYKLNNTADYNSDIAKRFSGAVDFVDAAISAIASAPNINLGPERVRGRMDWSFLDELANLMLELCFSASTVKSGDICWSIQYGTLWEKLFYGMQREQAWRMARRKLRRRIYDEVCNKNRQINFRSAGLLGMCLNIMGFSLNRSGGFDSEARPLKIALLQWTKQNYLRVHYHRPTLAAAILSGSVTFDEEHSRLIKTYGKRPDYAPTLEYLDLDPYEPSG